MKQPYARTYAKGRPTNGWERGELITTLADLQPGDVLIRVSHQFQAENLIRVVPLPEGFSPINSDRGFYYEYVDCRNCERSDGSLMFCWDWEFTDHPAAPRLASEIYRAIDRRASDRRKTRTRAGRLPL